MALARVPSSVHQLHGVRVASDLDLPCARTSGDAEFVVAAGARFSLPTSLAQPAERDVAALDAAPTGPRVIANDQGTRVTFRNYCDFFCDPGGRVSVQPAGDADRKALSQLLFPNGVLGALLGLQGVALLHASAVTTRDGDCIALVGPSGAGKSTLAATLCSQGMGLLADDSVRISTSDQVRLEPGATELRLRDDSRHLAALLSGEPRQTVDGRLGVRLAGAKDSQRLKLVLLPELVDDSGSDPKQPFAPTRITGRHAVVSLVANLRIGSWQPQFMTQLLPQLVHLARRTPIWRLRVPRGFHQQRPGRNQLLGAVERLLLDAEGSSS